MTTEIGVDIVMVIHPNRPTQAGETKDPQDREGDNSR